jgi:hypothetical protein
LDVSTQNIIMLSEINNIQTHTLVSQGEDLVIILRTTITLHRLVPEEKEKPFLVVP